MDCALVCSIAVFAAACSIWARDCFLGWGFRFRKYPGPAVVARLRGQPVGIQLRRMQRLVTRSICMQVQVHADDSIQGGDSLAQWAQEEVNAKLSRLKEYVVRVDVFFSSVDA